jgi:Peptide methionine sulfoxide reductase
VLSLPREHANRPSPRGLQTASYGPSHSHCQHQPSPEPRRALPEASQIFYLDEEQRRVATDTIADVEASGLWPGEVVTEVTAAGPFWEAEPEHQDYLERYPNGYTCHFPRPGWVLPHRSAAAREQTASVGKGGSG